MFFFYMTCVCSWYNTHSDWLVLGQCSFILSKGWLWTCKNQAKTHIIKNLRYKPRIVRSLWKNLKLLPCRIDQVIAAVRMSLLAWFDHLALKECFSHKDVQFKTCCRPVKTSCQAIHVSLLCHRFNHCIKEQKGSVAGHHLKEQHRK